MYAVSKELLAVYEYHVDRVYRDSGDAVERRRSDKHMSSFRVSIPYKQKYDHNYNESVSPYDNIGIAHQRSKIV